MRTYQQLKDNWIYAAFNLSGKDEPDFPDSESEPVTIPHVWNIDTPETEGCRLYLNEFTITDYSHGDCAYIEFSAVFGLCRVWLNGEYIGEHRGGYSLFRFEISHAVRKGKNRLIVAADNTRHDDIIPLGGDFNNYGGIYRDVNLIFAGNLHFDLLHYGTSGTEIKTQNNGAVNIRARVSGEKAGTEAQVEFSIIDGITEVDRIICDINSPEAQLKVSEPRLWRGKEDPYLYTASAKIIRDGKICDEVNLPFGFREISISSEEGFALNGTPLRINGVARHQDRYGSGPAPSKEELDEDLEMILEIGANAVRLSHYQHPGYFYDICDQAGLIVWAEIPMLGMPDGNEALKENAVQQLTELILQCKHHPSICFWGLQNEVALAGETLELYNGIERLQQTAKKLDDSRITAGANLYTVKNNSPLNNITDIIGYNIYFGWYYGEITEFEPFLDRFHRDNPGIPLGLAEYGVDCNVNLHSAKPKRKDYSEEFQAVYHETVYPYIQNRKYLWGSFVWNMFDFGSARRSEGRLEGLNGKGLVTYDRKIKKDSFYYFKSQWSVKPFVYIAGRRFQNRCAEETIIKVYSNLDEVTLIVNEKIFKQTVNNGICNFNQIPLQNGSNLVAAVSGDCSDRIIINRRKSPDKSYVYIDPNPDINVANWFTLNEGESEFFPEDRYTIMDSIQTLRSNPQTWALLQREVPMITEDPRSQAMPAISLFRVINFMSNKFTEEFVKDLNSRLKEVKKEQYSEK